MIDKKKIKNEYKLKKEPYGLYIIKNLVNNKILIGKTMNPSGKLSRVKMELDYGTHPYSELQNDYNTLGADKIEIEILIEVQIIDESYEEIKVKLKKMYKEWKEKLKIEGFIHY